MHGSLNYRHTVGDLIARGEISLAKNGTPFGNALTLTSQVPAASVEEAAFEAHVMHMADLVAGDIIQIMIRSTDTGATYTSLGGVLITRPVDSFDTEVI